MDFEDGGGSARARQEELDRKLVAWLRKEDLAEDDSAEWGLVDPEVSWQVYKLMEALDWKFLPYAGGLLDQPEWLIHDLLVISWRKRVVEEMLKPPLKEHNA